ncbi:MAG TPA: hypothetical protein VNS09_20620 [Solirubrobacter sp.]|nr:hypothetical protein [Solirubrobacter sp.]
MTRTTEDVFLDAAGCPVCAVREQALEQFFGWFVAEAAAEPALWGRLHDAAGFCPAHERRALRHPKLATLPHVVRGALARLDPAPPPRGPCPACEAERRAIAGAADLLARIGADPALRARAVARPSGVCLPHAIALTGVVAQDAPAAAAPRSTSRRPRLFGARPRVSGDGDAARPRASGAAGDGDGANSRASGDGDTADPRVSGDGDAADPRASGAAASPGHAARSRVFDVAAAADRAAGPSPRSSAVAGGEPVGDLSFLLDRLQEDASFGAVAGRDPDAAARATLRATLPADARAFAHTSAEAEWAAWAGEACPACSAGGQAETRYLEWRRREGRSARDPGALCAAHLHDLAAAPDPATDGAAADRAAGGLAARAGEIEAAHTHAAWMEQLRRATPRAPVCPACRARDEAEARHLDLALRLLAGPAGARRYEDAHGLCLRHAEMAAEPAVTTLLRAHLRVLDWEIAETRRKDEWAARHERRGAERTAPLRLAALLDGRTFLGGPARPVG